MASTLTQTTLSVCQLLRVLLVGLTLLVSGLAAAQSFDHLKTGFALTGRHTNTKCESCHISGVFKGTPKDCESCHSAGARTAAGNTLKPSNHIPTTASCATCHASTTFSGARMDHTIVTLGTCSSCHNGLISTGKPSGHLTTSASCDACHKTTGWFPASGFNHQGVVPGTCASCHNGQRAAGKSATHIPYQSVSSIGNASCDTCHKAGFNSWTPASLHRNVSVSIQCAACHAGIKPNTTIHIGQTTCENCHRSTTSWNTANVDHSTFSAATNCSSCHNGSAATGKPATHIPVGGTNCFSCHNTTGWRPTKWSHTQVPVINQCSNCHSGSFPPADGKPTNHIPYQLVAGLGTANCDTCHKAGYSTWAGARLHTNVSVSGQCKTCHSGTYVSQGATAKPSNHIPESQLLNGSAMECSACHNSTTSWTQRMNHNGSLGNGSGWCKNCHQTGVSYLGNMEKMSLTHDKRTGVTDCSQSGCHRPLGTKGSAYTKWN